MNSEMKEKIFVILTVDFEKDARFWHHPSKKFDYGGIMIGTHELVEILSTFGVKCTWFVEMNKDYPQSDMLFLFPYVVKSLAKRQDEIGVHIHWSKPNQLRGKYEYPTTNTSMLVHNSYYIEKSIKYCKEKLGEVGIKPVSFRSGAFFCVPWLPLILQRHGFIADSSSFQGYTTKRWPQSKILSQINRYKTLKPSKQPFFCDGKYCYKQGNLKIVEFPVNYSIDSLLRYEFLRRKIILEVRYRQRPCFLTLYFHVYNITDPDSGPDELTKIDYYKIRKLSILLEKLSKIDYLEFITLQEARQIFVDLDQNK
ncbi:MAG: hypothetical protein B5M53_03780 [Candidatus Cloacimonas sp. 4484_209]|nr:MAG: hypothetical protein B5M53_03780 [Candidatus Cloacimonas sp. 4484_209]